MSNSRDMKSSSNKALSLQYSKSVCSSVDRLEVFTYSYLEYNGVEGCDSDKEGIGTRTLKHEIHLGNYKAHCIVESVFHCTVTVWHISQSSRLIATNLG